MDQNISFWQHDSPFVWDEGGALSKLLAALEPEIADGDLIDLAAKQRPGDSAADLTTDVTRRLTALFQEQVEYIARLMDAPLCALYLADLEPADKRKRTRRAGREPQILARQGGPPPTRR